jgi:hypothetical protein
MTARQPGECWVQLHERQERASEDRLGGGRELDQASQGAGQGAIDGNRTDQLYEIK